MTVHFVPAGGARGHSLTSTTPKKGEKEPDMKRDKMGKGYYSVDRAIVAKIRNKQ